MGKSKYLIQTNSQSWNLLNRMIDKGSIMNDTNKMELTLEQHDENSSNLFLFLRQG